MGVDRSDYIVYGWKLPYKISNAKGLIDIWNEKFLPYIEGHQGEIYTVIRDGMSSKYTVFGILVESERGTSSSDGWDFTELDTSELDRESLIAKFEELFEMKVTLKPKLFIFSHFH